MLLIESSRILDYDLNFINCSDFSEHGSSGIQDVSYCNFFTLRKGVCVLGLKHPSTIYFRGILDIYCINGEVEVLGHIVKTFDKAQVFSLLGSSAMYISTSENSKIDKSLITIYEYCESKIDMKKVEEIINNIGRNGALLLLTSGMKFYNNWRHLLNEKNINVFPDYRTCDGISYFEEAEKTLDCIFDHYLGTRIDRKIITKKSWDNYIIKPSTATDTNFRLMICGGNGFGKSTLLRYLVNKTLSTIPEVVVIDFDIGQSEMNLSGCVSCHIVNKPLLGPRYTHLQQPKWCICLGKVNAKECVTDYIKAVKELMTKCYSDISITKLPWIINTMGFSRGVGVILTCATVRAVRPTTLLILKSERSQLKQHNFKESLIDNSMANLALHPFNYSNMNFPCEVINMEAPIDNVYLLPLYHTSRIASRKLREAGEVIYFSGQCHQIVLRILSVDLRENQWEMCHPGDVVSISNVDEFQTCLGFGKVISVDASNSTILIKTPDNILNNNRGPITITSVRQNPQDNETSDELITVSPETNDFKSWRSTVKYEGSKVSYAYRVFSTMLSNI